MSKVKMLERILENLDFMTQHLPPEECVEQFALWINRVSSSLEAAGMEKERVIWSSALDDHAVFSPEDATFVIQIETLRSVIEGFIESNKMLEAEFVSSKRIAELKAVSSKSFDLSKLIELCSEINICYAYDCLFATAMISRAILDHVPPIFGYKNFDQVVNNYAWGRSHATAIDHLNKSSREISNNLVHTMASQKADIPTRARVNCSDGIDIVLAEVVKILT